MVEPLFCNIDDKSTVYRFVSDLFQVCTYFLIDQDKVIIVDPGKLNEQVHQWLEQFNDIDKLIYITHEHFDHHFDVNLLLNNTRTSIYLPCDNLKNALNNSRTNISFYYNMPIETNCINVSTLNYFKIIATPGHSNYSYCFKYKNLLFGGDTVIEKKYLVFKLPGGDKSKFEQSVIKLNNETESNTIVLPGHGDLFCFNKWI
ncbi:MBL fold metallo-hydrolase [Flavobacterium sp.]|uniref:MBL fold metallo-hydrolase n=1 Tax=Flavobacterium sp. TaxID=239 RepID=UPI002869F718|nr:MBL fold metallo-hydrolase [Flavobacterium sp.]